MPTFLVSMCKHENDTMSNNSQDRMQTCILEKGYPEALYQAIYQPLQAYDFEHIGRYEMEDVAVHVRDRDGGIIGGVLAQLGLGRLFIQNNWVHEDYRNQGVGSQLLEHIEGYAREEGIRLVWLNTTAYLALDFYKRKGYKVYAKLPFYNVNSNGEQKKYMEYYMSKELS